MFFRKIVLNKFLAVVVGVVFLWVQTVWAAQIVCYMPKGPMRSTPQYNPATGFCETWPLDEYNNCPERYMYSQKLETCIDLPRCTGNNVYDLATKSCVPIGNQTQVGTGTNGTTKYDQICVVDKNGDGDISADELVECITTDDGSKLCPLDAAPCQARYVTPYCPSGYTYNSQTKTCQSNPTCIPGFVYNDYYMMCMQGVTCPFGGNIQNMNGQWKCVIGATISCPSGSSLQYQNGQPICVAGVSCPNGGWIQNVNGQWKCVAQAQINCPSGSTLDTSRKVCVTQPSDWKLRCPSGWKFVTHNIEDWSKFGDVMDLTINGETWSVMLQLRYNVLCDLDVLVNVCEEQYICTENDYYVVICGDQTVCYDTNPCWYGADGYSYISASDINSCTYNTCLPYLGCFYSFRKRDDKRQLCYYKNVCIGPYYAENLTSNGIFFTSPKKGDPICSQGWPNSQTGMCELAPNISCPSGYSYDPNSQLCVTNIPCPAGYSFDGSLWACKAAANISCPFGYSYDSSVQLCVTNISCPTGSTFNANLQACLAPPSCISGGSFNQNIGKCEGSASCPTGATLTDNGCFIGYFCPYGDYPCKPVNRVMMCSANQCLTTSQFEALQEDEPEEPNDYQDDGQIDNTGRCLGQIYIFNGERQRCRPPGWQVGIRNNCCDSKLAKGRLYDSTGSTGANFSLLKYSAAAIKASYDMIYFAYWFAQGKTYIAFGDGVIILSKSADFASPWVLNQGTKEFDATLNFINHYDDITTNADGIIEVVGGDKASITAAGSYAETLGPTLAMAITHIAISGIVKDPQLAAVLNLAADAVFFTMGLIGPVGFAAAVVGVIVGFLFGGGCDHKDIITVIKRESGRCHYVDKPCIKWLKVFGKKIKCLQRAKYYCCFNSKLARIIHEQGRPQLNTDIRNWGSGKHPNCRGFTPEEFASLDLDKIDLSEYIDDITRNVATDIETNIQQFFYDSIQTRTSSR
jgi:hypothetical protein